MMQKEEENKAKSICAGSKNKLRWWDSETDHLRHIVHAS